jgi:hypothetical protein
MTARQIIRDQRGVALPMAMIVLVLLTSLMLAFAMLAQTEPVIAHNQMRATQARAHAEAGFERAVWALSTGKASPGTAGTLANPLPGTPSSPTSTSPAVVAAAPYDGSAFVPVGTTGGFTVRVTTPFPGPDPNLRRIVSTGWTPTNSTADTRTKSHRMIQVDVRTFPDLALNAPCALCVKGELDVGGDSVIDSRLDTSCGQKYGTFTSSQVSIGGSATVYGALDGNNTPNQTTDYRRNQPTSAFDSITLGPADLDSLKELAKANGTYFGPGYSTTTNENGESTATTTTYDGQVHFSSGNMVKSGIVFIDTISGQNYIDQTTAQKTGRSPNQNPADLAQVQIDGNPFVSTNFQGYLIVNGSLAISGNMEIRGLVYSVDDLVYNGTGNGKISGLAISQNVVNVTRSAISSDSQTQGNSRIEFNCAATRTPGGNSLGFPLVRGSYRELSD